MTVNWKKVVCYRLDSILYSLYTFDINLPMVYLQADLVKVDRKRTPWLLALFHVPWYNSNEAHQGEGDGMMSAMEPLLHAAGVDIVFAGHVHAYERSV